MGPGPSTRYGTEERAALLGVARRSVVHGLRHGVPLPVEAGAYPALPRELRASFVTLRRSGALRGCTGSLEAHLPLIVDVARNAWRAAFRDPRFPPLRAEELEDLHFHVSVLSALRPFPVSCEAELLTSLRPGVDGLVLRDGAIGATFLPSVWDSRSEPVDFVAELKRKAGLPSDYWSSTLRFARYTVEEME
jgi:AmmeMemoRadiSam system protein A